jgi:endonuclease/exonuclease/phosphatase family metal-dependent hydrolase
MSFNVRNSGMDDGENGWSHRKGLFFQTVAAFGPDLLGLQEVLADQHDDVAAAMPGYTLSGVARDDGKRAGEWALVAFRTDRFEKLGGGDFWLSPTPDRPSIGWDAACIRICSWVKLRDRTTNHELLFANTHWDHVGVVARRNAAALIKQRLPTLSAGAPVVLTGDLNSTEDDDWVVSLLHPSAPGDVPLTDSYREAHPKRLPAEASFHDFTGGSEGSRIDFILHGPEFRTTAAGIDRTTKDGRYPSDHFPVTAVLEWR